MWTLTGLESRIGFASVSFRGLPRLPCPPKDGSVLRHETIQSRFQDHAFVFSR